MAKALGPEQVEMIWKLRDEKDGWGDPKWSGAYIAEQLGVSESTIWRVLTKRAAYAVKGVRKLADARVEKRVDAQFNALLSDSFDVAGRDSGALEAAAQASLVRMLAQETKRKALDALITPETLARKRELIGGE